jgi:SAM-dependent methyltransferase/aminoglycoside phosphotransferase (APT) family kinase protein
MNADPPELLCPRCRTALPWLESHPLVCAGCRTTYAVSEGIPLIRNNDDYYHELLPRERMRELIRRARSTDWRTALGEQIAQAPPRNRHALRTVFDDESRAGFKAILPALQDRRVLDLGCGSGVTSISLARWAREVVACDLTFERVSFLALRARAMGLANIRTLCAGDTRPLPFPDAAFDCVVLNGVLEWSAAEGQRPVRAGQLEFLREIRRILRPDGHLYIGIENRYGFRYFLGAPEDHTGVKYAAPVPRWAADVLVRRANGHPYRTYTYGRGGMRRLLAEAGFPHTRFFAPIPDYRDFREIHALDAAVARAGEPGDRWRARVRHWLERNRWLTPSFAVVSTARSTAKGWVEELASELAARQSIRGDGGYPRIRFSATSTAGMIIDLGREAIARVPLDPVNEIRVRRNFEGLARAQAIAASCGHFVAPRPLASGTLHGVPYAVESRVPGVAYARLAAREQLRADRQVVDLLLAMKSRRDAHAAAPDSPAVWRSNVIEPLRSIVDQLAGGRHDEATGLLRAALRIANPGIPLAFTHGDFWPGNLLFNGSGPPALIDWDRWAECDFATHDFLHYVCYRRVLRSGSAWSRAFCEWLDGAGADPVETDATRRFVERLALPGQWRIAAGLAYWVREVSGHHSSKLLLDADWRQRIVDDVLPTLGRHARDAAAMIGDRDAESERVDSA